MNQDKVFSSSIGKHLRAKNGTYKKDPRAIITKLSSEKQEYLNYLEVNGVKFPKIAFAEFKLRNGLPYQGLIATEPVGPNEELLRIPRKLILTLTDSYNSELKGFIDKNPQYFSPDASWTWEFRIVALYTLSEYKKERNSRFYHFINNLPRDIDFAALWSAEDLSYLEDDEFKAAISKRKEDYLEEEDAFIDLVSKHRQRFDSETFNRENFRWIWTHLITRAFGWMSGMPYTTFVPLAESINHHCNYLVHGAYYKNGEGYTSDMLQKPAHLKLQEEMNELETLDGSDGYSEEEFDFNYDIENIDNNQHPQKNEEINNSDTDLQKIMEKVEAVKKRLNTELEWKNGVNLVLITQVTLQLEEAITNYEKKNATLEEIFRILNEIDASVSKYCQEFQKYSERITLPIYDEDYFVESIQTEYKLHPNFDMKISVDGTIPLKDDNFEYFTISTTKRDQFEKGAQIYFIYGQMNNRTLLLDYGIAIEHNQHETYILKLPYLDSVRNYLKVDQLVDHELGNYLKFKLRRTSLNIELLNFLKISYFDINKYPLEALISPICIELEILAINKAIEILRAQTALFGKSTKQYNALLQDKNTKYRDYFIIVYNLERLRLLKSHIKNLKTLREILNRVGKGHGLETISCVPDGLENQKTLDRNISFLQRYLSMLKKD